MGNGRRQPGRHRSTTRTKWQTTEVVQVYLHDPVAEVARPAQQLVAAQRVELAPGATRRWCSACTPT